MLHLRNRSDRVTTFVKLAGNLYTVPRRKEGQKEGESIPVCEDALMSSLSEAVKSFPNIEIVQVEKNSKVVDEMKAAAAGREVQEWMNKPESEIRRELERRNVKIPEGVTAKDALIKILLKG